MKFGVTNRGNENIDSMLRRFKKKQKNSNFIVEFQNKRYYVKPSEKRNDINQKNKFIKKKLETERERSNIRL